MLGLKSSLIFVFPSPTVRGVHELGPRGDFSGFNLRRNSLYAVAQVNGISQCAIGLAGLPCTIVMGGTERVTTLPAVTTAPRPIVTLGRMIAPGPMYASSSIRTET